MAKTSSAGSAAREIAQYLHTGEHDPVFSAWAGRTVLDRVRAGSEDLTRALIKEVRSRTAGAASPCRLPNQDLVALVRSKVEPMVRGLFPRREQDVILDLLARSVVFLTPETIEDVLTKAGWPGTAWDLANLYLCSVGAELLAEDAPRIVGLSVEATCYVSAEYFSGKHRFADFIVHEAAHVFHNCKRGTVELEETRSREWLLTLEYRKRETFAYTCEAFSRILEQGHDRAPRKALLDEYAKCQMPPPDQVDAAEHLDILREAVESRNGWKRILARCSPPARASMRGAALS
jgi:hypothetical protein